MPTSTNLGTYLDVKADLDKALETIQSGQSGVRITFSDEYVNGELRRPAKAFATIWRARAHRFRSLTRKQLQQGDPGRPVVTPYDVLYLQIEGGSIVITLIESKFKKSMETLDGAPIDLSRKQLPRTEEEQAAEDEAAQLARELRGE